MMLVNREQNVFVSQPDRLQPPMILVALTCYIWIGHEMLAKKYSVSQATHWRVYLCMSFYFAHNRTPHQWNATGW